MKPYYEEDGVVIYNADCRDILPQLGKVDVVITDPPYGIELESHRGADWTIINDEVLTRYSIADTLEVFGNRCIAFADPQYPWPGHWDQHLVWDKGPAVGGGGDMWRYWKRSWELIQCRNLGILNGQRDPGVLQFWVTPADSRLHSCQKPQNLLAYLIGKVTAESILDPFMGSGTTLVAAKNLGRRTIGIEIERRYCDIAIQRLRQAVFSFVRNGHVS